jgi:hypothetical protein
LSVRQTGSRRWEGQGLTFLPFTEIDSQSYSTYLQVT